MEASPDNAIECVVHGCDVLNKRGFARPYVLSEHTQTNEMQWTAWFCWLL